jgi:hypothetical protein
MTGWLRLTDEQRRTSLEQASINCGINPKAIEKDWWVTLTLKVLFEMPFAHHFPQTAAVPPSAELVAAETEMADHKRLFALQQRKWKRKPQLKAAWLKTERTLLARIAAATQRIPNRTIPYNQIPAF